MLVIVEGFEMTGKSSFINKFLDDGNHVIYRCDYDLLSRTVGISNTWVAGQTVVDFLDKSKSDINVVLDRGIVSSYVYPYLKTDQNHLPEVVVDWYNNSDTINNHTIVYHLHHKDKETAEKIFDKSKNRDKDESCSIVKSYDDFKYFEDYWSEYLRFEELSKELYKKLPNLTVCDVDVLNGRFDFMSRSISI